MSDTNDILRKLAAQAGGEPRFRSGARAFERRRPQSSQQPFRVARGAAARRRRPCCFGDLSAARALARSLSPPLRRVQSSPTPCAAAWEGRAVDNDALSGLLNDRKHFRMRSGRSPRCSAHPMRAAHRTPSPRPTTRKHSSSRSSPASCRAAAPPSGRKKRALLSALRPFVAEDVASQFDRALRLAGMAGMARAALGQLEHRAEGGEHSV